MIDISLAGLLGAIVGTIVAAVIYHLSMARIEQHLRAKEAAKTVEERGRLAVKMAAVRRAVLTAVLAICAGTGYWLADRVWG